MNKFILILLLIPFLLHSQTSETIVSDRPGQANAAYTVGKGVIQGQHGFTFLEEKGTNFSGRGYYTTELKYLYFSNVIRYGLREKIELSGSFIYDFSDGTRFTSVGARYSLLKNEGWIPAIAVQGRILPTWQSESFRREKVGSIFNINTNNTFAKTLSLSTNWGIVFEGNEDADPSLFYVWNLGHSITDRFGIFFEVYGNLNDFNSNFDMGFSYLLNNNIQLDTSFGVDVSNTEDYWFGDIGISWRVQ